MIEYGRLLEYMDRWNKYTYENGLKFCHEIDDTVRDKTAEILRMQGLNEKYMDGNSSQRLPMVEEGKTVVIYSEILNEMNRYFTPVAFVAEIVKKCVSVGVNDNQTIAKNVGRGLRSLPSFVREMDLEQKLLKRLDGTESIRNVKEDIENHTDIMLKFNGVRYRLWSYQITSRGKHNTTQRIAGERGKLVAGFHVLCPFDKNSRKDIVDKDGWYLHSDSYVETVIECIKDEHYIEYPYLNRNLNKYIEHITKFKVNESYELY